MITDEHIELFLAQAHRYGDAKLMLCSSGYKGKKQCYKEFPFHRRRSTDFGYRFMGPYPCQRKSFYL